MCQTRHHLLLPRSERVYDQTKRVLRVDSLPSLHLTVSLPSWSSNCDSGWVIESLWCWWWKSLALEGRNALLLEPVVVRLPLYDNTFCAKTLFFWGCSLRKRQKQNPKTSCRQSFGGAGVFHFGANGRLMDAHPLARDSHLHPSIPFTRLLRYDS